MRMQWPNLAVACEVAVYRAAGIFDGPVLDTEGKGSILCQLRPAAAECALSSLMR